MQWRVNFFRKLRITDPNSNNTKELFDAKDELVPKLIKYKINAKTKKSCYDGKICNIICKKYGYDLVRAFTYTYQPIDKEFDTYSRIANGIELCLRNINSITNKEIV